MRRGVAEPTVYATFGSRCALLLALPDVLKAEKRVGAWRPAGAAADGDPARQVRERAQFGPRLFERGAALLAIARGAGTADPGLHALDRAGDDRRLAHDRSHVRAWAALGALRPEIEPSPAEDVVRTLLGPDVYRLLMQECGWPGERYEAWLVAELEGLLQQQWVSGGGAAGSEQLGHEADVAPRPISTRA